MTKILKLLAIFTFAIISTRSAFAATGDLSVQVSTPKSPTNQNSFNVNFVALDKADRPVTVKCFKKGPSDGGFVQFGSDFNLANGGNSDNCVVDGNIVNTNGTYQFYVEAIAGSDDINSNTVSVDYNTSGPGTPVSYSKEQINDCTWKIKFTTASDGGKTVKVEAYRSDNPSFGADPSNRFASISIGSGQNGETSITVPDCSKTWYFAVRAFDSAGNGSGIIGDSFTTTVYTTTITVTPAAGAIALGQGGNKNNVGTETVSPTPTVNGEGAATTTGETPQVEGAATTNWLNDGRVRFILILVVVAAAAYVFKKKFLSR